MKQILVSFNDIHEQMIKRLLDEAGYDSYQDIMRSAVRMLYKSEFKDYLERKRKIEPQKHEDQTQLIAKAADPVKYCREVLGGEVTEMDGQLYCVVDQNDGFTNYIPMPPQT